MARKNWTYLDEFERKHRQLLGAIERRIQRSFQGLHLATSQVLESVPFDSIDLATGFDLSRFPFIEAQIDALTEQTQKEILKTIQEAVRSTYAISTAKAIEMTTKYLGADASQLYIDTLQRAGSAATFQKQWFNNHPISERVWNITSQFKRNVEDRITTDLLNGVPADEVSRNIRGFLNEPNRLYRRVRGADGVLRLSKNARAYHPGQGVYRSSYKNARRLAVTEVNNAYRKADSDRWQQLDFVIGVRVQLSNNHTYRDHKGRLRTLVDICDDLKGDYPKDFVFTSWHPHCRCIATPILKSRKEMKADRERILRGEEPTPSPNEIKEMPANFKQWQKANASRIQGAMERDTLPHWYRDNQALIGGVQMESAETAHEVQAPYPSEWRQKNLTRAKARHQARTDDEILSTQYKWNNRQLNNAIESHYEQEGMSFERADSGNGNIGFSPKRRRYYVNCQSCVVSHEMRLRGHNVTARPNMETKNNMPYKLSQGKTEYAWINPRTMTRPVKQEAGGWNFLTRQSKTRKVQCDEFITNTRQAGRYHMIFVWKGKRSGHIVTLERKANGALFLYDPQVNASIVGEDKVIAFIKERISQSYPITTYRVDNLLADVNVVKRVVYKTMSDL